MPNLAELSGLEPSIDVHGFVPPSGWRDPGSRASTDLADLGELGSPTRTDDFPPGRELGRQRVRPPGPERYGKYLPHPRGVLDPVAGPLTEAPVLHALASCGSGWLHPDGRVLANGTHEDVDAMRHLPEMAPIFVRWESDVENAREVYESEYAEGLARHRALGKPDATFSHDDEWYRHFDPETDARRSIEKLGWTKIRLRRDRGVKEVLIHGGASGLPALQWRLAELAKALGCRVVANGHDPGPRILFDETGRKIPSPASPMRSWRTEPVTTRPEGFPGLGAQASAMGADGMQGAGSSAMPSNDVEKDDDQGPTPSF